MTTSATTTVIPRHGTEGIGRSNSSGGPPWTLSALVGFRKNIRGRRRRSLKLEIDEGIAVSLSKNDGAGHERPGCGHHRARQARHRGFDVAIAQPAVRQNHTDRNDADLPHFAGGKNGVAVSVSAKHAGEHPPGDGEIGGAKKYPCDANSEIGGKAGEKPGRAGDDPTFVFEQN